MYYTRLFMYYTCLFQIFVDKLMHEIFFTCVIIIAMMTTYYDVNYIDNTERI